ncbi:esterase [Spirosoma radiotolerans]|uniref:Esterase n=1 Tax=Spirosoma radiotolerans TaxID=1379870 RepID=A0A0E3V5Q2_9BACT|nr:esterase [Spirosoma radiotolerans]AKD53831.1 esterase [Spirosoma radiotolerans]
MLKSFFSQPLLWLLSALSGLALAQPPRGPLVMSPQVNADKTVTFRYQAPQAKAVELSAQFEKAPVAMTKDAQGIWSVTVGPVKPDIYPYSFRVDGVTVMDPANVAFFPNERFKASLVDIPGDTPLIHAMRDVPHGSINYEYYPSMEGTTGSLVVYTPPGYDQNPSKKYPVYYLISGTTDTEETFFKVGKTNLILDNLIAEGKAKPMIIVMPYGNIAARVAEQKGGSKPADPTVRDGADAVKRANDFATDLVKNVIPYTEKSYRTIPNRENRAIGGFSRGGGQTLRTAFSNMDKFAWVCAYSSYLSPEEMDRSYPALVSNAAQTNKQLKLLWVSVGSDDFLYKGTVEFMDYLKAKNVNYKSLITDGGHTWMNVKTYVAATTPLLFQQ